ncbi:hypothetical protein B2J93_1305 [Marssonina coronariae]|uniref:Uncharacterized protein n=1 Tax=Diplocarpon coronariae TaxID=2795749 RepID=A0A218Z423_9HELO|nr:hypothetical protein B2J93_1305 [Marssonina coronariae]
MSWATSMHLEDLSWLSVKRFIKGTIGFFDTNAPQKNWHLYHPVIDGRIQICNRNVLPNAVKKFFETRFFCCYEYEDLTADTEKTMVQLVQRGIALTPAEKMRAMSTKWAMFIRQFEDDYALIEILARQTQRKRTSSTLPLQARLEAIFGRYEHLIKLSSTQITATRFKVNSNSVFDPAPKYLRAANTNNVRTFSPLELVVTAILVATHMDHRSEEQLLEDVKELRTWLRRKHKDLRVNAQCWAMAWSFITMSPGQTRDQTPPSSAPSSPSPEMEIRQVKVRAGAKKRLLVKGQRKSVAQGNGIGKPRGAGSGSDAKASRVARSSKARRPPEEPVFENL